MLTHKVNDQKVTSPWNSKQAAQEILNSTDIVKKKEKQLSNRRELDRLLVYVYFYFLVFKLKNVPGFLVYSCVYLIYISPSF